MLGLALRDDNTAIVRYTAPGQTADVIRQSSIGDYGGYFEAPLPEWNGGKVFVVHLGDFCGWPYAMGNEPPYPGAVAPIYVFKVIVAPTGLTAVNGSNSFFRTGCLLGAFVTKALY